MSVTRALHSTTVILSYWYTVVVKVVVGGGKDGDSDGYNSGDEGDNVVG